MESIGILVLDDEKYARQSIISLLNEYLNEDFRLYEAASIEEAYTLLSTIKIDLAFLDIALREGTSFDLLIRLKEIPFKIVFISGHDEYAVRAFRFNAVDYLLKPIYPDEFIVALERVQEIIPLSASGLEKLGNDMKSEKIDSIVLKSVSSIHVVKINDINYCKSDGNYTTFYLDDDKTITIAKPIKDYEKMLRGANFFRAHRSFLINLSQVKSFEKRDNGFITLSGNHEVPLAKNKKDSFMLAIGIDS